MGDDNYNINDVLKMKMKYPQKLLLNSDKQKKKNNPTIQSIKLSPNKIKKKNSSSSKINYQSTNHSSVCTIPQYHPISYIEHT